MPNLSKILIPKPQKLTSCGKTVKIAEFNTPDFTIEAAAGDVKISEGVKIIREKLFNIAAIDTEGGNYKITVTVDAKNEKLKDIDKAEAYFIEVGDTCATLCGKDAAGAFYAAVTFADMIYVEGDGVFVEMAEIIDYPDFMRRGHFIEDRYGTEFLTLDDWKNFIDYSAIMKLNTLTIGVYGCWTYQYDSKIAEYIYIPIKKYPEIKSPKDVKYFSVKENKWIYKKDVLPYMYEQDFLGDIIAYGKTKNVLVKPLFNSLGHNTLLPRIFPEISAKHEDGTPTNSGFCTKSERTYEILFDIYDEIIDRYLLPNGVYDIQIGLDEVTPDAVCHCEMCRDKTHPELMIEYIIKVCKHLKARGMKHIYIYHDMLFHHFDMVNEDLRDLFIKEGIYDEVVLDWWTYEYPTTLFWGKTDKVNNLFHSVIKPFTGYHHWSTAGDNNENVRACAKVAKDLSFEGMETYSSLEYCYDKNYLTVADVSWNNSTIDDMEEFNERYAYRNYPKNAAKALNAFHAIRDAMIDETHANYAARINRFFEYYPYCYRNKDGTLKNFPGAAFEKIRSDEAEYVAYLERLKQKSSVAIEFFENSGTSSLANDVWLLTAKHYYTVSDEYLTVYGLDKAYNNGTADAFEVIRELKRLIAQRERLMLLAENVRIDATAQTYLRNMSNFRQYLIDLYTYFECELKAGRAPKLDVTNLDYVQSRAALFLR